MFWVAYTKVCNSLRATLKQALISRTKCTSWSVSPRSRITVTSIRLCNTMPRAISSLTVILFSLDTVIHTNRQDIYTDGASTTVNRFIHGIQGVQGVPCCQLCTSSSAPIQGKIFTSTVPPVFQQIRPTRWGSQTNVDNDTPLRTAVALQGDTCASDTDFVTDDYTQVENKRKAKRLRRRTNQEFDGRISFAATLSNQLHKPSLHLQLNRSGLSAERMSLKDYSPESRERRW